MFRGGTDGGVDGRGTNRGMRRIIVAVLAVGFLAGVVTTARSPSASAAPNPGDAALVSVFARLAPVLLADQQRVYAVTRTFLNAPIGDTGVLAATGQLSKDVSRMKNAIRSLMPESKSGQTARNYLYRAILDYGMAVRDWNAFANEYAAYAKGSPTVPRYKILNDYDHAAEVFKWAVAWIRRVNDLLGKPEGKTIPNPPRVTLPGVHALSWKPGWDDTKQPLNYGSSYVSVDTSTPRALTITYHLEGAAPGSGHPVGLHLLLPAGSACVVQRLGRYPLSACGDATRQGVTMTASYIDFGVLQVDAAGNGDLTVKLTGVAPGTYPVEFDVRSASGLAVIYQAPGPFGTTAAVTIGG